MAAFFMAGNTPEKRRLYDSDDEPYSWYICYVTLHPMDVIYEI